MFRRAKRLLASTLTVSFILATAVYAAPKYVYIDTGGVIKGYDLDLATSDNPKYKEAFENDFKNATMAFREIIVVDDVSGTLSMDPTNWQKSGGNYDAWKEEAPTGAEPGSYENMIIGENGDPVPDVSVPQVDKTQLQAEINAANEKIIGVEISENGEDITTDKYWVTQQDMDELETAIRTATVVLETTGATQEQIDNAAVVMKNAADLFVPQQGSKVAEIAVSGVRVISLTDLEITISGIIPEGSVIGKEAFKVSSKASPVGTSTSATIANVKRVETSNVFLMKLSEPAGKYITVGPADAPSTGDDTRIIKGTPFDAEAFTTSGKVVIAEGSTVEEAVAGENTITGLDDSARYFVEIMSGYDAGSYVVAAAGTIEDTQASFSASVITPLRNDIEYKITYDLSTEVILAEGSLGTAGSKKITLEEGNYIIQIVAGDTKVGQYVTNATGTTNEARGAITIASGGGDVTGLTNGVTYNVGKSAATDTALSVAGEQDATGKLTLTITETPAATWKSSLTKVVLKDGAGAVKGEYTDTAVLRAAGTTIAIPLASLPAGLAYATTYVAELIAPQFEVIASSGITLRTAAAEYAPTATAEAPEGDAKISQTLKAQVPNKDTDDNFKNASKPFADPSYTYQWYRCDTGASADAGKKIDGATSSTYKITNEDVGSYLKVMVTASGSLTGSVLSVATEQVVGIEDIPAITSIAAVKNGVNGVINITFDQPIGLLSSQADSLFAFGGATIKALASGGLRIGNDFATMTNVTADNINDEGADKTKWLTGTCLQIAYTGSGTNTHLLFGINENMVVPAGESENTNAVAEFEAVLLALGTTEDQIASLVALEASDNEITENTTINFDLSENVISEIATGKTLTVYGTGEIKLADAEAVLPGATVTVMGNLAEVVIDSAAFVNGTEPFYALDANGVITFKATGSRTDSQGATDNIGTDIIITAGKVTLNGADYGDQGDEGHTIMDIDTLTVKSGATLVIADSATLDIHANEKDTAIINLTVEANGGLIGGDGSKVQFSGNPKTSGTGLSNTSNFYDAEKAKVSVASSIEAGKDTVFTWSESDPEGWKLPAEPPAEG